MQHEAEGEASKAFAQLRAEVSLLRRAIESIAAERDGTPDYGPTIETLADRLDALTGSMRILAGRPALQLNPQQYAAEMLKVSEQAKARESQHAQQARDELQSAISRIDAITRRGLAASQQRRWIFGAASLGLVAGGFLWATLPGPIARSLPERWHLPERMAARTMDLDERAAGKRLIRVAERREKPDGAKNPD